MLTGTLAPRSVDARIVLLPRIVLVNGSPVIRLLPRFVPDPEPAGLLPGLPTVSDAVWNETAVRKVLHTFAFGAQSTDRQVSAWAAMPPADAIVQMLHFGEHNARLSEPVSEDTDGVASRDGSLRGLADFLASNSSPLERARRATHEAGRNSSTYQTWLLAARMRGLNPFRQKIGLFETNYHMAVNLGGAVGSYQVFRYYDDVMQAHADGVPYHEVINTAALSAAVARQYGHHRNRWRYRRRSDSFECVCNDDFAREYHQLFFGILGSADSAYHENVSIENTAIALTDMNLRAEEANSDNAGALVDFEIDEHPAEALEILGQSIDGVDAEAKITSLSEIAIEHYESLAQLPYIIVQTLADDELSDSELAALRRAWRSMPNKSLLQFLRAYAVSELFHSAERVKRWTSIDRYLIGANTVWHNNVEHYRNLPASSVLLNVEGVRPFYPEHDVFGHQTGLEAASSSELFRLHWNAATSGGNRYFGSDRTFNDGVKVTRDWSKLAPRETDGSFRVATVGRWLWRRLIADGGKHYGPLEVAQVHALLAEGQALAWLLDESDPDRVFSFSELADGMPVAQLVEQLGRRALLLEGGDERVRSDTTRNIGQAVAFITATPFMFVQEGL